MAEQALNEIDLSIVRCVHGHQPYAIYLNELVIERKQIAEYIDKERERNSTVVTISTPSFK